MAEQGITKLEELEYKWVDGYKHRSILADIGWDYSIRDGYTTDSQDVINLTNTLEECLRYKNTGIPNLMDYLLGEIGGEAYLADIAGTELFNKIYKGVQQLFEGIDINHLGDVYTYKKMIDDVESGNFGYILDHVEEQIAVIKDFTEGLSDEIEGFRYYYEGRGLNILGAIQPGDSDYYLHGFENDSRGYIYTEDWDAMKELYDITDSFYYLEGNLPGLREDLPKSIINTRYMYLLEPNNEDELQRVLDYVEETIRNRARGMDGGEAITMSRLYKQGIGQRELEYDIDDYYGVEE